MSADSRQLFKSLPTSDYRMRSQGSEQTYLTTDHRGRRGGVI